LRLRGFDFVTLCCGGLFATTSTARSKRDHASVDNSGVFGRLDMSTFDQKGNALYANLMGEVRVRFDCINRAGVNVARYPGPVVREFCWLQLRMICELVALSCLVAHGDMKSLQSHSVGKSYSADEIIDKLTKLRPHFYPIPIKQRLINPAAPPGKRQFDLTPVNPSPLPKEAFLALYGKTHRHLHRGSLKKLMSAETQIDMNVNFPEIIEHTQKISDLLSQHAIAITESKILLCMLINPENKDRVQVASAEGADAAHILK
jgi:hypothetical protein